MQMIQYITNTTDEMELIINEVETEGNKYGMKLNRDKCESLNSVAGAEPIKFADGVEIQKKDIVKYLGCMLNQKANTLKEINKRIAEVYLTWKKLGEFWKHSNCSIRQKLIV